MEKPARISPIKRIQQNLLYAAERRTLLWFCRRLPLWVTPDRLTILGVASAVMISAAYAASNLHPLWLWVAVAGYVVHWFGDSLDGSLARHRNIERPTYGYFVDHSADGFSTLLIMVGMGLSPYLRMDIALLGVAGYLLLSVHTFLVTTVTKVFRLSHLGFGPTELRLVLIALTALMFFLGPDRGRVGGFSPFDLIVGAGALVCMLLFVVQTLRTAAQLLQAEPTTSKVVEEEEEAG